MRPLLNEFVAWLQSAEYDDEEAYGEEETKEAQDGAGEDEEKKEVEETEDQRNQRLLIQAQK